MPESIPEPSPEAIRERVRTEWAERGTGLLGVDFGRGPPGLLDALTAQLHAAIVQRAGTNGHCYGMALAAQAYFEQPETLPIDRESAAEIRHPTEPVETPDAPIYDAIVSLQAEQFLRFRAWLGRRALLWPDRIDVDAQLDDVRAVIDVFGTAQVSVFDGRTSGHQVLAYDYEERRNGVSVRVYDPNYRASTYGRATRAIEFEETADGLAMQPYDKYERVLFNRHDRIEAATDRATVTPLDHVDVGAEELRESVFPLALVTVDTQDVDLALVDPNGRRLGRLGSDFMDRSRGSVVRLRSAYGADPGTYRVRLYGHRATPYELQVRIAGPDGTRLSTSHAARIETGETQEFAATVPDAPDGTGTFEPVERRIGRLPLAVGAASGGAALGAGAHYLWRRHRDDGGDEERG